MKVTLWRDEARLRQRVDAAAQRHDTRIRLYLCVEDEGIAGYGEIDPQPQSLNGDAGVDDIVRELRDVVFAQLSAVYARESELPSWTRLARFAGPRPESSPAVTLFEMAILDRELRRNGLSIRSLWPKYYDTATQVTVSAIDDEAEWYVHPSVARVRVKTQPGPLSRLALDKLGELDRPILLDFNCSANDDTDVLGQIQQLSGVVSIDAIEQPFAVGNVIDHARLGEQTDIPLSLDEGVRSGRDLEQIVRYHAARVVCIKPARVGGYANAKTMVLRAKELGLDAYLGGFFESGFARSLHRTFAHHLVSQPSDLGTVETDFSESDAIDVPLGFEVAPSPSVLERAHRVVLTL